MANWELVVSCDGSSREGKMNRHYCCDWRNRCVVVIVIVFQVTVVICISWGQISLEEFESPFEKLKVFEIQNFNIKPAAANK